MLFAVRTMTMMSSYEDRHLEENYYFLEGFFQHDPPRNFPCPVCLSPVQREAFLTRCCGAHFCRLCISRIVKDAGKCPLCKATPLEIFPNKERQRNINELQVNCPVSLSAPHSNALPSAENGNGNQEEILQKCAWVGELGQLNVHLNKTHRKWSVSSRSVSLARYLQKQYNASIHMDAFLQHAQKFKFLMRCSAHHLQRAVHNCSINVESWIACMKYHEEMSKLLDHMSHIKIKGWLGHNHVIMRFFEELTNYRQDMLLVHREVFEPVTSDHRDLEEVRSLGCAPVEHRDRPFVALKCNNGSVHHRSLGYLHEKDELLEFGHLDNNVGQCTRSEENFLREFYEGDETDQVIDLGLSEDHILSSTGKFDIGSRHPNNMPSRLHNIPARYRESLQRDEMTGEYVNTDSEWCGSFEDLVEDETDGYESSRESSLASKLVEASGASTLPFSTPGSSGIKRRKTYSDAVYQRHILSPILQVPPLPPPPSLTCAHNRNTTWKTVGAPVTIQPPVRTCNKLSIPLMLPPPPPPPPLPPLVAAAVLPALSTHTSHCPMHYGLSNLSTSYNTM